MIDVELNDDQQQLRVSVRRLIDQLGGLALSRQVHERRAGYSADLWQALIEMDVAGMVIPTEFGGSGGGVLDALAVCLETGYSALASPLIPSSVVAASALVDGQATNPSPAQAALIGRIASGRAVVAPALLESSGVWDARGVETTLTLPHPTPLGLPTSQDGHSETQPGWDEGRLSGRKMVVAFADIAERLLVSVRSVHGISLVLVDPTADGATLTPLDNIAGMPLFAVDLADVSITADDVVGEIGKGWPILARTMARGAVLRAAEIAGAGERLMHLAVDYASQRQQFGTPIGSYQAVQYLCTDLGIGSHLSNLLARRAAWQIDTGRPSDRAVAAAKLYASRAAAHMAQQAHEVFAGIGYMVEHDLHLLTSQLKYWEHDSGDVRHHSAALVGALADDDDRRLLAGLDPNTALI